MNTDRDWRKWGETDPYFGVLTDDRFRADAISANRDLFFETGDRDVEMILERFTRCFGPLPRTSVLDFGCGVGRLTLAFARHFEVATGLDISDAMLAEARTNAQQLDMGNARFAVSDALLSAATGQYDFVNSLIVLQHIPVGRGLPIIGQLLDRVRPGGGCMIHVAVQRRSSRLRRLTYSIRHHIPLGKEMLNLAMGRPLNGLSMQMNEYPILDVMNLFTERGMSEILVNSSDHGGVTTLSLTSRRPD